MVFPAFCAETIGTDVAVQSDVRSATDITRAIKSWDVVGVFKVGVIAYFFFVFLGVLEIFAEFFDVPLKLPEEKQAPAFI